MKAKVKSKMLGLAIVAMLALGAMASVASAAEFHSEAASTTLSGAQPAAFNDQFTFDAGTVECENASYSGSLSGATTTTDNLTPSYSGCTATFGLEVDIHIYGCEFVTHAGHIDLVCGPVIVIVFTSPGCVITVGPQNGLGTVSYTNEGSGTKRSIIADVSVTGLAYEEHNKGFFPTCANNTVAKTNGQYHSRATITGSSGGKQVGIWFE